MEEIFDVFDLPGHNYIRPLLALGTGIEDEEK
jgi:hypothetical protein